jgi:hypothetical protein
LASPGDGLLAQEHAEKTDQGDERRGGGPHPQETVDEAYAEAEDQRDEPGSHGAKLSSPPADPIRTAARTYRPPTATRRGES